MSNSNYSSEEVSKKYDDEKKHILNMIYLYKSLIQEMKAVKMLDYNKEYFSACDYANYWMERLKNLELEGK